MARACLQTSYHLNNETIDSLRNIWTKMHPMSGKRQKANSLDRGAPLQRALDRGSLEDAVVDHLSAWERHATTKRKMPTRTARSSGRETARTGVRISAVPCAADARHA